MIEAGERPRWERREWVRALAGLTAAFDAAAELGGSPARPRLPGSLTDHLVSGLEGFARMSVAWGAWLGGPGNPVVLRGRGRRVDVLALTTRGLLEGTDADGPWWWGEPGDRDQRIVEAAELATGLWLGRARLVPALGAEGLTRVLDWLGRVDGKDVYPDNWVLFPSFVATVQRGLGRAVPDAAIDRGLDEMVERYRGDGWYADGPGDAFDQYTGWAVHWHLLLWASIDGARRHRLRRLIQRRARTYLAGIVPLFAADGRRPLQGRSLGYRFAAAAPFALAEFLGLGAVPSAAARRITEGTIAQHLAAGAIDPATGWFRRGIAGERPDVCERYMSTGAAAWAAHALVVLGLPSDAPFWTAADHLLPVETSDGLVPLRGPGFLLGRRRRTGETWLLSARAGHPDDIPGHDYTPFYGKIGYRSHFPMTVRTSDGHPGPDDAILFEADGLATHRAITDDGAAGTAWTWSRYRVPLGARTHGATTVVLPWRDVEVRVTGLRPGGPIRLVEGSAALSAGRPGDIRRRSCPAEAWEAAATSAASVAIRRLLGYDRQRSSGSFRGGPDRNLVADHAEQPTVSESGPSRSRRIVASVTAAVAEPTVPVEQLVAVAARAVGDGVVEVGLGADERAIAVVSHHPIRRLHLDGRVVDGPGIRVVRYDRDWQHVRGEAIGAIEGIVRLGRPGLIDLRRGDGAVDVITASGFRLEAAWAGFDPRWLAVEGPDGTWGLGEPLAERGRIPSSMIRRLRRMSGRSLATVRVLP
jgi:hypothetical protein